MAKYNNAQLRTTLIRVDRAAAKLLKALAEVDDCSIREELNKLLELKTQAKQIQFEITPHVMRVQSMPVSVQRERIVSVPIQGERSIPCPIQKQNGYGGATNGNH